MKLNYGTLGLPKTAMRVPPAVNQDLWGSPLKSAVRQSIYLGSYTDTKIFSEITASARNEDVELARPQLHFLLGEVHERVVSYSVDTRNVAAGSNTPLELLKSILTGVSVDSEDLYQVSLRNPKSVEAAKMLAGVEYYLAELAVFTSRLATQSDDSFTKLAEQADRKFTQFADKVDRFRSATAAVYPEISKNVRPSDLVLAEAKQAIEDADLSIPQLTKRRIKEIQAQCGRFEILWNLAFEGNRVKFIESGAYVPLNDAKAAKLKKEMSDLLIEYNEVFNRQGIIAQLRQLAVSEQYIALWHMNTAEKMEQYIRGKSPLRLEDITTFKARIDKELKELPANQERARNDCAKRLEMVNGLKDFLKKVSDDLHPTRNTGATLSFERIDNALVGRLSSSEDRVIVIYNDPQRSHPKAVLAVEMPAHLIADGVPHIEDVYGSRDLSKSNYHSVEECLSEFGNEIESEFFFSNEVVVSHNAFHLLAAEKAAKNESNEPSMRM